MAQARPKAGAAFFCAGPLAQATRNAVLVRQSSPRVAYRRQPTADEVQTLLTFFEQDEQGGFEQGIRRRWNA